MSRSNLSPWTKTAKNLPKPQRGPSLYDKEREARIAAEQKAREEANRADEANLTNNVTGFVLAHVLADKLDKERDPHRIATICINERRRCLSVGEAFDYRFTALEALHRILKRRSEQANEPAPLPPAPNHSMRTGEGVDWTKGKEERDAAIQLRTDLQRMKLNPWSIPSGGNNSNPGSGVGR